MRTDSWRPEVTFGTLAALTPCKASQRLARWAVTPAPTLPSWNNNQSGDEEYLALCPTSTARPRLLETDGALSHQAISKAAAPPHK